MGKWDETDEAKFVHRVNEALKRVRQLLHNARNPQLPSSDATPHTYDDKYLLAEFLTHTALAAELNALSGLGFSSEHLRQLAQWERDQNQVTLSFQAGHRCRFLRMVERKIEGPKEVTTVGRILRFTEKVVTKTKEYHWKVAYSWKLVAYPGVRTEEAVVICEHAGKGETITSSDQPPTPEVYQHPAAEVNITWLLRSVSRVGKTRFAIDRSHPKCRTPRRNPDIKQALINFRQLGGWTALVNRYFSDQLFPLQDTASLQMSAITDQPLPFVPILPLFDPTLETLAEAASSSSSSASSSVPSLVISSSSSSLLGSSSSPRSRSKEKRSKRRHHHDRSKSPSRGQSVPSLPIVSPAQSAPALSGSNSGSSSQLALPPPSVPSISTSSLSTSSGPESPRKHRSPRQFLSSLVRRSESTSTLDTSITSVVSDDDPAAPPASVDAETAETTAATANAEKKRSKSPRARSGLQAARCRLVLGGRHESLVVLPISDLHLFLEEQRRSLDEKLSTLVEIFPRRKSLVTGGDVQLLVIVNHLRDLSGGFQDGVNFIEQMLYQQLEKAIGHEVTAVDFANYMRFHNQRLFDQPFRLRPFCQAVRQPNHSPEGTVSIETLLDDGSSYQPILTSSRLLPPSSTPMTFPLGAAAQVSFFGDRYIHGWMGFSFAGDSGAEATLFARARQFSSFIVLLGNMHSPTLFSPNHALIIKNKDELRVPLVLTTIPSAKEFQDAIGSLSPEQKEFAQAYRSMQLESTLFAVCVLEIKPQMERLLNLPPDSLIKELSLTDDLMDLFIKYQIPSDLLSFAGSPDASPDHKVEAVKANVRNMMEMIDNIRREQLRKQAEKAALKQLEEQQQQQHRHHHHLHFVQRLRSADVEEPRKGGNKKLDKKKKKKRVSEKMMEREECVMSDEGGSAPMPESSSVSEPTPDASAPEPLAGDQGGEPAPTTEEAPNEPSSVVPSGNGDDDTFDFTAVPQQFEDVFGQLDPEGVVRPTIISLATEWSKISQESVLSDPQTATLNSTGQNEEKKKAFDLIDCLSRSGSLAFTHSALHVVVASSHGFSKSIVDTVITDNVNPIEKVERTFLIASSIIQSQPVHNLLKADQRRRLLASSPILFSDALPPRSS